MLHCGNGNFRFCEMAYVLGQWSQGPAPKKRMEAMATLIEFNHFVIAPLNDYQAANDLHSAQARLGGMVLAALSGVPRKIKAGLLEPLSLAFKQARRGRDSDRWRDRGLADIGIEPGDTATVVYVSFAAKTAKKAVAAEGKTAADVQAANDNDRRGPTARRQK